MKIGLLCFFLAASPSSARAEVSEIKEVSAAVEGLAEELVEALQEKKGKVGVLGFNPVTDPAAQSAFGQLVQDQLSSQLAARRKKARYEVVERKEIYKVMEDSRLFGKDEELFDKLQEKIGMDYVVSGSYAYTDKEITVTASLLNSETGVVEASARAIIANGPGLLRMLRPQARPGEKAAEGDKVSLDLAVVYLGADGKMHPVREGTVMTADDHYAVYLKAAQECYVYIYQVDTAGQTMRLFPNADFQTRGNLLKAGEEIWAPSDKSFYYLDENKGSETIYVIATRESQPALEGLVSANKNEFTDKVKGLRLMGAGGTRAVNVVKAKPIQGNDADILSRQLGAASDFVYSVSFQHR